MSKGIFKFKLNEQEIDLADLYAPPTGISGSVVNYLSGYNDASNNTGIVNQVGFLAEGQTTTITNNGVFIDRQNNGNIPTLYKNINTFPYLSASYKDYGLEYLNSTSSIKNSTLISLNLEDQEIPIYCKNIIAIVIGGGGWINTCRSTNDQHDTSGGGGGGGIIAWKSPALTSTNKFDINIQYGRQKEIGTDSYDYNSGQYPGNGGNAKITIKNTTGVVMGSCQANGGHQSNWVTGDDDDDTHNNSRSGGVGGTTTFSKGTSLYSYNGVNGPNGVSSWDDGTNSTNNSRAEAVDSWTNAGRGAYWDTGDSNGSTDQGGTPPISGYYNYLAATRIEGGSNGAIRVYFIQ